MDDIRKAVGEAVSEDVYKIVLSAPVPGAGPYRRVTINRLPSGYQAEQFTETQVFHENLPPDPETLHAWLAERLGSAFRQLNAWDARHEHAVRVTAKGRVLASRTPARQAPRAETAHDRVKSRILPEGTVVPALVDMGVMTPDGHVIQSMYDKFRQINRFLEVIDDEIRRMDIRDRLTVIDFGCGKSYLTFVLYHYLTAVRGIRADILGLDLKADVIAQCGRVAAKYGYDGLRFEQGDIGDARGDAPVDMVVTLHACDTATDLALYHAVRRGARLIFSVPCCQHELNAQIEGGRLSALTRYGIVKERFAALMTDAVRANLLECCGYRTQLLEFIEMEHTPKNLLIRAVRRPARQEGATRERALAEVDALREEFGVEPTLYRLLREAGRI
ncbi:MAG: SAM-dependent methyltransferase [Clostridia bacterium]|nr:SAM-dependent methyltransferase [Clostridia bacterium]